MIVSVSEISPSCLS